MYLCSRSLHWSRLCFFDQRDDRMSGALSHILNFFFHALTPGRRPNNNISQKKGGHRRKNSNRGKKSDSSSEPRVAHGSCGAEAPCRCAPKPSAAARPWIAADVKWRAAAARPSPSACRAPILEAAKRKFRKRKAFAILHTEPGQDRWGGKLWHAR